MPLQFDDNTMRTVSATAFHISNGDGALEVTTPTRSRDSRLDEFKSSQWFYLRLPNDNVTDW